MRGRWRGRVLYREVSTSEKIADLVDLDGKAAALYFLLLPHVDDLGRHEASPRTVKAIACPLVEAIPSRRVRPLLEKIETVGLIQLYAAGGRDYLQLTPWKQGLTNAAKSDIPDPPPRDPTPTERTGTGTGTGGERARARPLGHARSRSKPSATSNGADPRVSAVYAHWRSYHPRSAPGIVRGSDEEKKILARLDSFGVEELKEAIDGNHQDPHCCGQNDRKKSYHDLGLIFRTDGHVTKYREVLDGPEPSAAPRSASGDLAAELDRRAAAERNGSTGHSGAQKDGWPK